MESLNEYIGIVVIHNMLSVTIGDWCMKPCICMQGFLSAIIK